MIVALHSIEIDNRLAGGVMEITIALLGMISMMVLVIVTTNDMKMSSVSTSKNERVR